MKPYFSKLLTEQERAGSRNRSAKWGKRIKVEDPDSEYDNQVVGSVKMCRRNRETTNGDYNWKELTDCLNPLYGYLLKSVGRAWDAVYSELCENLDRRSVSGLHVFSHLWQFVERDCVVCADGKVRYWGGTYLSKPTDFYIHPYTGILCVGEEWRKRYRAPKPKEQGSVAIEVSADGLCGKSYQILEGIWYYTEWTKEDRFAGYFPRDVHFGRSPWMTKQEVVVLKKRQLGKKELKKLGLRNIMVGAVGPKVGELPRNGANAL